MPLLLEGGTIRPGVSLLDAAVAEGLNWTPPLLLLLLLLPLRINDNDVVNDNAARRFCHLIYLLTVLYCTMEIVQLLWYVRL